MKYMMFVCTDTEPDTDKADEPDIDVWVAENDARGRRLEGNALVSKSAATTIRVRNGELLVSDGPFAETKEVIVGYDILECADAVAHGYAYGAAVGLALLAEARTGGALDDYPLAMAAEADLTAHHGDRHRGAALFRQAAAVAHSEPERRALSDRAEELFTWSRWVRRALRNSLATERTAGDDVESQSTTRQERYGRAGLRRRGTFQRGLPVLLRGATV